MRCENCGGEISLEAAFCEYCGSPNPHAQSHAREMKRFRRDFEKSRSSVHSAVRSYTGLSVRMVIIVLLILAIFLLFLFGGRAYSVRRMIVQGRTERNAVKVMAQMDELLKAEEFLAFNAFCEENYVDCFDSVFEKYAPAERAAAAFSYVYRDIMSLAAPPEYAQREDAIAALADDLGYFYDVADIADYEYYEGADSQQNRAALAAMKERLELLLISHCGLSAGEAESVEALSAARRAILLEEALLDGE